MHWKNHPIDGGIAQCTRGVAQPCVTDIVVGGRHFWLFVLAGDPPFILYTCLIYHLYTLRIYTTIYIFRHQRAARNVENRPQTTMVTEPRSKGLGAEHANTPQ